MAEIKAGDFREFFTVLHNHPPFPWQQALAEKVCEEGWKNVKVIDLPTASGKTACIDIALFALAVGQVKIPRRIFFVVDRRVVVNEAYLRMREVRDKLEDALKSDEGGILRSVAEEFRRLAGKDSDDDAKPLLVSEMRGGAFRDETWVKNPLQPTVIASTVDQVGSRLLFRGYGVSQYSWPMHAGLIANDALIFLDEAHCSHAFAQTLDRVKKYRGGDWATDPIHTPFHFVQMTATPAGDSVDLDKTFRLSENDRIEPTLRKRLQAAKPTRLIVFKGKKDDTSKLAEELVRHAIDLAGRTDARRVVIFVNRVKTAKEVHKQLREHEKLNGAQIELLIGSMRPIDRDDLYEGKLKKLKSGEPLNHPRTFVVSTQCLEVGADLDFEVLVSECASIDALQQRFGRLNRMGNFERAQAAIVMGSWQIDPKQPDPVYGTALSETWKWLDGIKDEADMVNMGIEAAPEAPLTVQQQLTEAHSALRLQAEDAPVLLPAHVDMLAQTSPVPVPSPSVEFFLHGPKRSVPDVQVVWRSDLEHAHTEEEESKIVEFCPPSTREAMSVSIAAFKKWFAGEKDVHGKESDLEIGVEEEAPIQRRNEKLYALVWDGEKAERISDAGKIKPGQTLILKKSFGGWDKLGHIPDGAAIDVGDRAAFPVRNGVSLRLHPELMKEWPESPALRSLADDLLQSNVGLEEVRDRLEACRDELKKELDGESDPRWKHWPYQFLGALGNLRRKEPIIYPGNEDHPGKQDIYVLRARRGADKKKSNGKPVLLKDHLKDVEDAATEMASALPASLAHLKEALCASARLHDYGKVDIRFQALLRNGDLAAARFAPQPIAKSGNDPLRKQKPTGLPEHFRHELLSLMFAEKCPGAEGEMRDLILHLVASHHGRCRPFAPIIFDEGAECVSHEGLSVCKEERDKNAPHHLGRGVADRFWELTATYGWWGLAYLESLLRLADWKASESEAAEVSN